MGNIRIVTDSTADIPLEIRERLNIKMVPLKVHFGNEAFLDAVTIGADDFYAKLGTASALPTTSQPSPVDFMHVYQEILQDDPQASIISIHLSAALSGTYQSAVLACSLLEGEGEADITVIDSKSASYGIGVLVVMAAEMALAGSSKADIVTRIEQKMAERRLYFVVDTLEYLQRGGRIGKAAALFGSILNIKPILTVDGEGVVAPVDKVRGSKKAMQRIIELLKRDFNNEPVAITVAYSYNRQPAEELRALVEANFDVKHVSYTTIGAVIGTHVGPGTAAVFMLRA